MQSVSEGLIYYVHVLIYQGVIRNDLYVKTLLPILGYIGHKNTVFYFNNLEMDSMLVEVNNEIYNMGIIKIIYILYI